MNETTILGIVIAIICVGVLIGIFRTKKAGFGRYTTSMIILTLVLAISSLLLIVDKIATSDFVNIIFAIVGYGGGLVVGKIEDK